MEIAAPRALIVTVYGLYGRPAGWLPVAGLVRVLAELDVDEPAVRSAISRLKRRGLLHAERRAGIAGYALSAAASEIIDEGDARIFAPPVPTMADGWLLAVFSVPEAERAKRHTLRTRLSALGFGAAAAGVWIAPAHRYELAVATLRRDSLAAYVDLFRGDYLAFGDIRTHARVWWDLEGVAAAYAEFMAEAGPTGRPLADWVRVLTAWRRLPYRDPMLPAELLPPDWPGDQARARFGALRAALDRPAAAVAISLLDPRSADSTG